MLTRCLAVSGQRSIELLGPGDVLRAAEWADGFGTVPKESRWRALDAGVIAVLDRGWHDRLGRWPEIHAALLDRAVERSRSTALCLALARVRNLSARLRLLLWHLADRWGRVEPEGIALPLSLSHETLAELCARGENRCAGRSRSSRATTS